MKINVEHEDGCRMRDARCRIASVANRAAFGKTPAVSPKAFKGVQKVNFACNGTALFRLISANSPCFAFLWARSIGESLAARKGGRKLHERVRNRAKTHKTSAFARLCPLRPPLPAFFWRKEFPGFDKKCQTSLPALISRVTLCRV